jgi:hypothetical protein
VMVCIDTQKNSRSSNVLVTYSATDLVLAKQFGCI